MSAALAQKARVALGVMKLPSHPRQLYPALHKVAADIAEPGGYAAAVGAVFEAVCEACGVRYGSQYMAQGLISKFQDGTLGEALAKLKG